MTLNRYGLTFHHLGLAAKHPEKALHLLKGLGYDAGEPVEDPSQKVGLILCTCAVMPTIEVIYQTEAAGPLKGYLKQSAAIIYHICYETTDLQESLKALKEDNNTVMLVSPPKPAIFFAGRKVSFYHIHGLGLVEILETRKHQGDCRTS